MTVFFRYSRALILGATFILSAGNCTVWGHDLFLRPASYYTPPKESEQVIVLNGSFAESINTVSESLVDTIYLSKASEIIELPIDGWVDSESKTGFWRSLFKSNSINLEDTNTFELPTTQMESLALGVSLYPSRIAMERDEFLNYLRTEAYVEIDLDSFGFTESDDIIRERYLKTAKTLIQVGDRETNNVTKPIGQIIEIVPLTHPGNIKTGGTLNFQILLEGEILAGQPVAAGMLSELATRTDEERILLTSNSKGIIEVPILQSGVYWLKLIHLRPAPEGDSMDFNSYWASLTFDIVK